MAITWTVNITNVDVSEKRADVFFNRLDDETEENYSFKGVILETLAQKTALLNLVWDKHLAYLQEQTNIENFISNLEATAKANLEAREV